MLKDELFLKALNSDTCLITEWVTKAFSLFKENSEDWKKDPYLYRIVSAVDGWHYVDENQQLQKIEDAEAGKPVWRAFDPLHLKVGDIANVTKEVDTTYGNAVVNNILFAHWFGSRIEFMTGVITPDRASEAVLERLVDDPAEGQSIPEGKISVSEHIDFCNAAFNLTAYTQVFTPAATEKSMTAPPDIVELRSTIIARNKDRINDPAVIADIARQLQEYDYEYLRGDPSLGFMLKDKSLKLVRTKLFLMYGAEPGLEETVDLKLIERSLSEGWDIEKFPEMNNAQRAGSYFRGKETERGGAKVKEIYRAAGNMGIAIEDCGSELGVEFNSKGKDKKQLIGFTAIEPSGEQVKITEQNIGNYLGKVVKLRSPMYCKAEKTDYCAVCCGDRIATNPKGLPLEMTAYGSRFLDMYMAAAHAKALTTRKLEFSRLIS